MPKAIALRNDFDAKELRGLAAKTKDGAQATRLLALAAVADGLARADAARISGLNAQTLRYWVRRFNRYGPDGLVNGKSTGRPRKLSPVQLDELRAIVTTAVRRGDGASDRWRAADLVCLIKQKFDVDHDRVSARRILKQLVATGEGPSSARPAG